MSDESFIPSVERYYSAKLREYGATARGVDWTGEDSQQLRFDRLLELIGDDHGAFSINDYGCGYGALVDALARRYSGFRYAGYDISPAMVAEATARYAGEERAAFTSNRDELLRADFTVASGIFNVKLETEPEVWFAYVLDTIATMVRLSERAIAFNALTSHADAEYKRPDLFYADPAELLDHCLRTHSRDILLRHDYGLYEFTVILRLDRRPPSRGERGSN
jgi:SAM-dependent methyltransferase